MIDPQVFAKAWSLICERWNRETTNELSKLYYDAISERLSTEQFRVAAAHVLANNEFWPRPADFWEAISEDTEALALEQWELCYRVMEGETHVLDRMSPAGQRAVALLGGVGRLRNTPLDSVPFVRKEFLELHETVTDGAAHKLIGSEVTPESKQIIGKVMRGAKYLPPKTSALMKEVA